MNLSYVIYMTICFLAFVQVKAFKYIESFAKLKDKTLLLGLKFAIFYTLTTLLKDQLNKKSSFYIEGHEDGSRHSNPHEPFENQPSRRDRRDRRRGRGGQPMARAGNVMSNVDANIQKIIDNRAGSNGRRGSPSARVTNSP